MAPGAICFGQIRQEKKFKDRISLDGMRENEVVERYRLSSERIRWLVNKLSPELRRRTKRNFPLSCEVQVRLSTSNLLLKYIFY